MLFEVVVKVQVYCDVARRGRSAAFACVRSAAAGEIDLLGASQADSIVRDTPRGSERKLFN